MKPPLRVVPPSPAQLAADPGAPYVVFVSIDLEAATAAAKRRGLRASAGGGLLKLLASRDDLRWLAHELQGQAPALIAALGGYLQPVAHWRLRTRSLPLDAPIVMGIVNLTHDSFSGDGVGHEAERALHRAEGLRRAGAAIIDVGAETARADRPAMDETREARLIAPVVAALAREGYCVSCDTYKPYVARAALECGAEIINDISGLTLGLGAAAEAAAAHAGYVLNYSYSVPKRRPASPPLYADVVAETLAWMFQRLDQLDAIGFARDHIAVDPGIAFGKSHDEDIQVLRRIGELTTLGQPLLLAHSRKNYIGSISGQPPPDRDLQTHVTSALAYEQGARIFRVHDPEGARRALEMAAAIASAPVGAFAPGSESWPWRAGVSAAHMTQAEPDKPAPKGQRW